MCERCKALDAKIERYQHISKWLTDKQILENLRALIADYEAEKKVLHTQD